MINLLKLGIIVLLAWCLWSVDRMESNMLILKQQIGITQVAHNKLVEVVYALDKKSR